MLSFFFFLSFILFLFLSIAQHARPYITRPFQFSRKLLPLHIHIYSTFVQMAIIQPRLSIIEFLDFIVAAHI